MESKPDIKSSQERKKIRIKQITIRIPEKEKKILR
jgi:hypothetical protein